MSDVIGVGESLSVQVIRAPHNDISITTITLIIIVAILFIMLIKG